MSVPRTCDSRVTAGRRPTGWTDPRRSPTDGRAGCFHRSDTILSLSKCFSEPGRRPPEPLLGGGLVSEVRAPGAPHRAFVPQEAQVRGRVWPAGRPWPLCPEKQPAGQQDACAHQPQAHTETRGPGPSCPLSPAGRVTGASLPSPGLGFCVRETERQSRPREVAPGMRPPLSDGTCWVDRLVPFGHRQPHVATEHLRRD